MKKLSNLSNNGKRRRKLIITYKGFALMGSNWHEIKSAQHMTIDEMLPNCSYETHMAIGECIWKSFSQKSLN